MIYADVINNFVPSTRKIENVKVGDIFNAFPRDVNSGDEKTKKQYRVFTVYPYHINTIGDDGEIRSFCLGELVKLHLEPSNARICDAKEATVKDYD